MFDVGDLVVCVDATSPPLDEPFFSASDIRRGYAFLVQGKHYRVSGVVRDGMLRFPGDPFPPVHHIGFNPSRFRKIDAPDTEVSRLIRACKPAREGQPA